MSLQIYLSLGSNEGNRLLHIENSLRMINQVVGPVQQLSSIYLTAPWGESHQHENSFLNQVAEIHTPLSAPSLLEELMGVEWLMGRDQQNRDLPRPMDIDILLFDRHIVSDPGLIIPHPLMTRRRFVLTPLAEIAPHFIHPLLRVSIAELLINCTDSSSVKPYNPREDD